MSIKYFLEKIKQLYSNLRDRTYSPEKGFKIKEDLYIVSIIILVGTASFGLGKISSYEKGKTPISILRTKESMLSTVLVGNDSLNGTLEADNISREGNMDSNGVVVASKSGTKYYYPWCAGVIKIKDENKVWFNSIDDAKSAGLAPASNCAGLK